MSEDGLLQVNHHILRHFCRPLLSLGLSGFGQDAVRRKFAQSARQLEVVHSCCALSSEACSGRFLSPCASTITEK